MEVLITEIKKELILRITMENIPRIQKCMSILSEDEIWKSPNSQIPSIGNLILHLNGNVRQWFLHGFCGISFTRIRNEEFSARKTYNKLQLIELLNALSADVECNTHVINIKLLTDKKMIQKHFFVSGYAIINHITEHFSYHTGQIATLTKLVTNTDLGFYDQLDL